MLKKTIKFKDFNDREREEEFYFHLSQAKIIRWNMMYVKDDGIEGYFKKIMAAQDGEALFAFIEKMVLDSYGKKTADGGFLQNDELRSEFESSPAYSQLLMGMIQDADSAAAFLNGIIPEGFAEEAAKLQAAGERPPNRAERRHPSDTAAQSPPPGPRPGASSLQDRIHEAQPAIQPEVPDPTAVEEPIVLTRAQLIEMDDAELRSGLATGKYKLQ